MSARKPADDSPAEKAQVSTRRSALPPVVSDPVALRAAVSAARGAGQKIGVVPTMGALHAGHLSLVDASAAACDFTVVTIYVNPTQFGPGEDYQKYPRNLAADLAALTGRGVDLVFAPESDQIYVASHCTFVDMAGPALPLEGKFRPGHFRGVATIVLKLLNLVQPDVAFFGRKDYQQSLVVRRLAADFDLPIEVRICPTVREPDGLALSSRNAYLDAEGRRQALVLSRSLRLAAEMAAAGERRSAPILAAMRALFAQEPQVRVQYLVLADAETLAEVDELTAPAIALVAAYVGQTRLIDNELLGLEFTNRFPRAPGQAT